MGPVRHERGQVVPALVLVMAAVVIVTLLVARAGGAAAGRARARTAADAAALAGVTGGRSAAEHIADEDGGSLESFHSDGDEVEVTVRVGDRRATARARSEVGPSW